LLDRVAAGGGPTLELRLPQLLRLGFRLRRHQLAAIRTAAAWRSVPKTAWSSIRTRLELVAPAFSSNVCNETGLAYSFPNAEASTTAGAGIVFETRTFIPNMSAGANLVAPNTHIFSEPDVCSTSRASLAAGVRISVSGL